MKQALSRRDAIRMGAALTALSGLTACSPASNKSKTAATTASDPDLHLLRRTTFGPSPADRVRLGELGGEAWLEEQLTAGPEDPPQVAERLEPLETLTMRPDELIALKDNGRVARQRIAATIIRHLSNPNQLFEVMVDFWSDHFSLFLRDGPVLFLKGPDDHRVIRRHALGSFPAMLRASAQSPAMLVYLDNAQSRRPNPNENYARELLELHTLGVDGGYNQADVESAAAAFTGWTVEPLRSRRDAPGEFLYLESWHDPSPKVFLGDPLAASGMGEGLELLDRLAGHPSTALNLSRKLCSRFVSDRPPAQLVDRLASVHLESEGDIPSMLRALFHSAEFAASAGAKLKRGLDFTISTLRTLQIEVLPERLLGGTLRALGHVPFSWPAPDGFPHENSAWSDSNQLLSRWSFALQLLERSHRGDLPGDAPWAPAASGPEALIEASAQHLLGEPLRPDVYEVLLGFTDEMGADPDWRGLASLILASPQFQRR